MTQSQVLGCLEHHPWGRGGGGEWSQSRVKKACAQEKGDPEPLPPSRLADPGRSAQSWAQGSSAQGAQGAGPVASRGPGPAVRMCRDAQKAQGEGLFAEETHCFTARPCGRSSTRAASVQDC